MKVPSAFPPEHALWMSSSCICTLLDVDARQQVSHSRPAGCAGLHPTVAAIKAGKDICLANKETLIAGGPYVLPLAREHGVNILPADSEHSVRALPAATRLRSGPVRHPVCMC